MDPDNKKHQKIFEKYNNLSIEKLKKQADKNDLDNSGTKSEIVKRLTEFKIKEKNKRKRKRKRKLKRRNFSKSISK